MISSEGEAGVLANLNRKAAAAEGMFDRLAELMAAELTLERAVPTALNHEVPAWL